MRTINQINRKTNRYDKLYKSDAKTKGAFSKKLLTLAGIVHW
jgi:hypothetical protein